MLHPEELQVICESFTEPTWGLPTPVHNVSTWGKHIWMKRDDHLGFWGGTKTRKYNALLFDIRKKKQTHVHIIGGANSNHVPGLLSYLKPHGITCELWLKESHQKEVKGTAWFTQLLQGNEPVHKVSKADWPDVFSHVRQKVGTEAYICPEGAACEAAIPGSLSLPIEVMLQQEKIGSDFSEVWVDAGTGFTAGVLIAGLTQLGFLGAVHVVQTAATKEDVMFWKDKTVHWLQHFLKKIPKSQIQVQFHQPVSAKSFGSVNATVLKAVRKIASETGVLVDPIYTAKLMMTFCDFQRAQPVPKSPILVIHGGGTAALAGFQ